MRKQELLSRLMQDAQADVQDYLHLRDQLQAQFEAALRHEAARTQTVAQHITSLVDQLEQRRADRVRIVTSLLPSHAPISIPALMATLPQKLQNALQPVWTQLHSLVHECKTLNVRNRQLMTDQQTILGRVLHGDEDTYADA